MQLTGAAALAVEAPHLCLLLSLIAVSAVCYFGPRGQSASLRRKQGEESQPSVWCGWKSWKPLDQVKMCWGSVTLQEKHVKRKTSLSVFKWLNRKMALIQTTCHLITTMYQLLFVAVERCNIVTQVHRLITSSAKVLWFDIIGKFMELTENEPCCYWAKGGQSKCKENSESKQTHSLASDGMAPSLFPTILPDSSVHNHTNQVVVCNITTNVPDLIWFLPKEKKNSFTFLAIHMMYLQFWTYWQW